MLLSIKNLRVATVLGVYEEERHAERDVVINLRIDYDHRDALRTDSLEDALDYKEIRDPDCKDRCRRQVSVARNSCGPDCSRIDLR